MIPEPNTLIDAALVCDGLGFRYAPGARWIIKDFDHQFSPGITFVKGSSGCGKSTLLRLLAGYLAPEQGQIRTPNGLAVRSSAFQRQELGFVFQQINLLPLATLDRNLQLAGSLAGQPAGVTRDRARHWLS